MRVLVLTKVEGRPFVLIGQRVDHRTGLDTNPLIGDNPTV
jgi:hypothetical protein